MSAYRNAFEHQHFRLRHAETGEAVAPRSFRDIITGDDAPLRFDYGPEYINVAALGLCAALTQAAFSPGGVRDLESRLAAPVSPDDFDTVVSPLRDRFTIDGPAGTRFLQWPAPGPERYTKGRNEGRLKKGEDLSALLLTTGRHDKTFLNRPDARWAVRPDQIPLLLFARHTFYEKSAGRGYKNGTTSDMEVRTYLLDRDGNAPGSLRRSVWLNVLSREEREINCEKWFSDSSKAMARSWMWEALPDDDVEQGTLSLAHGLLWMVAHTWVELGEVEGSHRCIVTGERIEPGEESVGIKAVVQATNVGYGTKPSKNEARASFFLHPNGPYGIQQKDHAHEHLTVDELRGLVGHAAALLFAEGFEQKAGKRTVALQTAPLVDQLYGLAERPEVDLMPFGFHMTGSQGNLNTHAAYQIERYRYPRLADDEERQRAQQITSGYIQFADEAARKLAYYVQICTMKDVDVEEETVEDSKGMRRRKLSFNLKRKAVPAERVAEEALIAFWHRIGQSFHALLGVIEDAATAPGGLDVHQDSVSGWARQTVGHHVLSAFAPVFQRFGGSPQHLIAAHEADQRLRGWLRFRKVRTSPRTPPEPPDFHPSDPTYS